MSTCTWRPGPDIVTAADGTALGAALRRDVIARVEGSALVEVGEP